MIVVVKTRGNKVKSLEKKLISEDAKKSCYRIKDSDLIEVLQHIYLETGICKVKLVIEEPSDVGMKKETQLEYLERITSKNLYILEEDKDVKAFFKAIGFKDNSNILYNLYDAITKVEPDFVEKVKETNYGSLGSIYSAVFIELYPTVKKYYSAINTSSPEYKALQKSISTWMEKHCKERSKNIGYNVFLKLLLKHTGYKYY